uniref:Adenosine 3'-phospho 5'-phosphosulfate transporter 1 n=1 Tax=Pinguiococcus pyrenoidosus TaxID=172671 RepID=A0A7R9U519_9STRA
MQDEAREPMLDKDGKSALAEEAPPPVHATKALPSEESGGTTMLIFCFVGLQVAYVSWGIIQERMMTQPYSRTTADGDTEEGKFPSVIFLVAANRFLALMVAAVLMSRDHSGKPLIGKDSILDAGVENVSNDAMLIATRIQRFLQLFLPSSLSNVFSSFFQYKALVFVTFPTQVLFKANKIIPSMLMGKLLQGKSYPWRDYGEALVISGSVAAFMLSEKDPPEKEEDVGTASLAAFGVACLCLYLAFDAFTSQWQSRVFNKHAVTQYQMMFGVNCCSLLTTTSNLIVSQTFFECLSFINAYPTSMYHIMLFSIASSVGQLFIFYTIKRYGAVMFSIIMTTRQVLSMVVSYILFGHPISITGALAAAVVFSVLGVRIRRRSQKK